MTCFEDYEVLKILGTNINSSCYKVKNKTTSEVHIWKAINCENLSITKEELLVKVSERIKLENKNILKCCNYIYHEETCTIYLVTEFCEYGTLENLLQRCIKSNETLCENIIWTILYKVACFLKTHSEVGIKLQDIFITSDFDVKYLHFNLKNYNGPEILDIGKIAYLLIQQKSTLSNEEIFPEYYSNELKALVTYLSDTVDDLKSRVDAVLCHPTALVKLTLTHSKHDVFIKNKKNDNKESGSSTDIKSITIENSEVYQKKLENLRKREAKLKVSEEVIEEKNRQLSNREKKVALMERVVKEKVAQAELYLKRARDLRSSSSGSGKGTTATIKKFYDKTDTSFSADCGDNSILPTSQKLNVKEIVKPQKFVRTMSERRVRFKSHSPLKEIHNIKNEFSKKKSFPDIKEENKRSSKLIPSDSEKTSESNSEKCVVDNKKKFIFASMFKKPKRPNSVASSSDSVSAHTYEDIEQRGWEGFNEDLQDCKPINWNEDSKKQAFDLLRIMNSECNIEQIKHTYL